MQYQQPVTPAVTTPIKTDDQPRNHLSIKGLETLQRESAEVVRFTAKDWPTYKDGIIAVERGAFGENAFSPEALYSGACAPTSRTFLVIDNISKDVIGFTYAFCDRHMPYVCNTALLPSRQGRGLILPLMEELEGCLRNEGYDRMYRHARVEGGYADKIERFYGSRVIESGPENPSAWGPLRTIVVSLIESPNVGNQP